MPRDASAETDPDEGGMIDLDTFEAMHVDQPEEAEADPDALPSVSDARRQELKARARRMIEERLKARRRQRRLMRGGEL